MRQPRPERGDQPPPCGDSAAGTFRLKLQDEAWRKRVETVHLAVTRSPCAFCVHDLVTAIRTDVKHAKTAPLIQPRRAILSWRQLYVNDRQGLTTTLEHIKNLKTLDGILRPYTEPVHRFHWPTKKPST